MRVGIITIPDFNNYGNRLQNYALQEMVKKAGSIPVSYVPYKPNIFKKIIKTILGKEFTGSVNYKIKRLLRLNEFIKFDNKNVTTVAIGNTIYSSQLSEQCDFFIAGSDQIWNPMWYTGYSFLDFAENSKKMAYAASFGCDKIPDNAVEVYTKYLESFRKITVREESGREIIEKLLNRQVEVVPDPTLALSSEEWKMIEKKPIGLKKKKSYILTYFLGEMDSEREKIISSIKENNCMDLYDIMSQEKNGVYISGPAEFVYLIDNADIVLTDSFHACVFSIIFGKKFIVFDRLGKGNEMGNRIYTLLKMFELEKCKFHDSFNPYEYDKERTDRIMEIRRNEAQNILNSMIKMVEYDSKV